MTTPLRTTTAFVLILLNLAVAVAPHIGHADEGITVGATDELRAHTCGANEIHKDIKDHNDCLLCSRAANFVAFVVCAFIPTDSNIEFFAVPTSEQSYSSESSSPFHLRGPPTLLS